MFENLCLRDLQAYAGMMGAEVFHYRDDAGLEADAVVEAPDGQWGAFEIKYSPRKADSGAAALCKLRDKIVAKGGAGPAFLAVLTSTGVAATRADGVHVIPIGTLGP
jgi:hypothetical protein